MLRGPQLALVKRKRLDSRIRTWYLPCILSRLDSLCSCGWKLVQDTPAESYWHLRAAEQPSVVALKAIKIKPLSLLRLREEGQII